MVPGAAAGGLDLSGDAASSPIYNVLDYGALGDGKTDDTLSIRKAIAALSSQEEGGTLYFPSNYTFISQPLNISSNTQVLVAGVLKASPNSTALWPIIPPLPWFGGGVDAPMSGAPEWQPFLLATGENISFGGGGVIDGSGGSAGWWACAHGTPPLAAAPCSGYSRPRLLQPRHVITFLLEDLTLINSPAWTIHLANVSGATLRNFSVTAPADQGNTDGVDPDCSDHIRISDFLYSGGDDAVAVKAGLDWLGREFGRPTEDVVVERLTILSGNGFAIGSEMSAGVHRVRFENVTVDCATTMCKHGLYIKTERGRGGAVSDIEVVNATVRHVGFGHGFTEEYQRNVPPTNTSATPSITNITIMGGAILAPSSSSFSFQGLPESVISGVVLDGVVVEAGIKPAQCGNTTGVCKGMAPKDCPPCFKVLE